MPKNVAFEVRWGRIGEWKEILAVTNRAFNVTRGGFLADWPHSYTGPEAAARCVVADTGAAIVGGANTVPIEIRIGRASIPATILCGVGVDPGFRNRGIMSAMISFAHDELRRKGVVLTFLWGNRKRYAHFGYEIAGLSHYVTVDRAAFRGVRPAKLRRLGPSDAAAITALHRRDAFSVARTSLWQERLLSSKRTEALGNRTGRLSAYAVFAKKSVLAGDVLETSGDEKSIARLLAALMRRSRADKIRVWCGPGSAAARLFYPGMEQTFGTDLQIHAATHAAILDFKGFLTVVAPALHENFRRFGIAAPVVLGCTDRRCAVVLRPSTAGLAVQTARAGAKPDMTGDSRFWVRRFFPPPGACLVDLPHPDIPQDSFALPFVYPPWDIA